MLDHLDHIHVNFRNPTQHREARYDLEEAQDLLSLSIDALNRMAKSCASAGASGSVRVYTTAKTACSCGFRTLMDQPGRPEAHS
jgi:hypothetical protein